MLDSKKQSRFEKRYQERAKARVLVRQIEIDTEIARSEYDKYVEMLRSAERLAGAERMRAEAHRQTTWYKVMFNRTFHRDSQHGRTGYLFIGRIR